MMHVVLDFGRGAIGIGPAGVQADPDLAWPKTTKYPWNVLRHGLCARSLPLTWSRVGRFLNIVCALWLRHHCCLGSVWARHRLLSESLFSKIWTSWWLTLADFFPQTRECLASLQAMCNKHTQKIVQIPLFVAFFQGGGSAAHPSPRKS